MYSCAKCSATWPDELVDDWGTHQESSGHGPEPKCVNLVPSRRNPKAPDGSTPREVCGGRLTYTEQPAKVRDAHKDFGGEKKVNPIKAGER